MKRRIVSRLIFALMTPFTVPQAHAQSWGANHPWRASDNSRLAEQNYRISKGVQDGQLSSAQAQQLRANDHAIRTEERADSSVNGTHLTPQEQRTITSQENANSTAIYGARH